MPNNRRQLPEGSSLTSATPQRLPKKQKALFRDVLVLLNENRIPFAVSGAVALQKHTGICRDTKDLDIFLSAEDASAALACLMKNGFECEICDPVWLAEEHPGRCFFGLIPGMGKPGVPVEWSLVKHS